MKGLEIPRTFSESAWIRCGSKEEWRQHIGKPSVSYSMINSFESYNKEWIKRYCFGIQEDIGIFAKFGTAVGEAVETCGGKIDTEWLDEDTQDHLAKVYYGDEYQYERPILFIIEVNGVEVVMYGFIDVYGDSPDIVCDIKTGSIKNKTAFYAGEEYMQTKLYSYSLDLEGINVTDTYVLLLDRKGNGRKGHPLRLTGESLKIPTPYVRGEVEDYIENKMKKTILNISDFYKTYKKIFT